MYAGGQAGRHPGFADTVGAYLAALAPRHRLATLRRRLAAPARAHRSGGGNRHPIFSGPRCFAVA